MPDARAVRYVGWLLRANRLQSHDKTLRSGREFARAFRCDGAQPLAPSHITRWESGQLAPSHATIRRYEHLLGAPAESLVAINDYLRRLEGLPPQRSTDNSFDPDADRQRLHDLLERAQTTGSMTGAHWSELTEMVAAQPALVLHPQQLWREMADRLLGELAIATYGEWLQRQEAMSRLLEHSDAGRHAIAACIALAGDQSSPVVIEPLSLLDVTSHADANRHILGQIEQPDDERAMQGALLAAIRKVSQGHFRDREWSQLSDRLNECLRDSTLSQTLLPLAIEVSLRLTRQMPEATSLQRTLARLHITGVTADPGTTDPSVVRAISNRIAARARADLREENADTDDTGALLIKESVYHPNPDRRLITSMLIAATPYQLPIARAMLHELTADLARRGGTLPSSTLRTLTDLNVDIHRPLIHDILTRPGFGVTVRHAAAWATPHCPGQNSVPEWRKVLAVQFAAWIQEPSVLHDSILHGITYGIGTDGHQQLLNEICHEQQMPQSARTTASWLRQGN